MFVCDVQKRFEKLIPHVDAMLHTSRMVIGAAAELKVPVVVTEQTPAKLSRTSDLLQSALPADTFLFEKTSFSMMTPQVWKTMTNDLPHVDSVILLGIEAHICVLQTTLDLLHRGYKVHLVTDACFSQREHDRLTAFEVRSWRAVCLFVLCVLCAR